MAAAAMSPDLHSPASDHLMADALTPHGKHVDSHASQVHTPPITDEASHKDDDAASTSSLSDLGDVDIDADVEMTMKMGIGIDMDHQPEMKLDGDDGSNRLRFEEAARAGAEAEKLSKVKPHHYENNVPIFEPTMDEFRDFYKYVQGVNPYGMQSGIVKIVPPEEWKRARKALDEHVKTIKIKNPITQEFHGAQGIYTQRNMEKMRSYNLPQWKAICEQTENQPPARRGEKRLNADKLLGRGAARNRKTEAGPPSAAGPKRRAGRSVEIKQEEPDDHDSSLAAPPTPTSPDFHATEHVKTEDGEQTAQPTPTKGKRSRKSSVKPRARQPKSAPKKDAGGKGAETTVAARRLRNAGTAADEIDEEAFRDFDYRYHENDQFTPDRCEELEDKYWKSLNFSNPMYAADMPGSLFDADTTEWNVAKLPNLLDMLGQQIPGVNTAYLYLGMWRATFAWHLEDVDLYSINYIHFGAPKQWYSVSQKDAPKFENAMKSIWSSDAKNCDQFLRHKTYLVSPSLLKSKFGVTVNKVVHREGEFVITFPIGYHSGYNLGYNCAESVNFATEDWLQYGKTARKCQCESDSVFIDVDWFIRRINGEPSPEFEEVEVTDDEDELDDGTDLMTPPASDHGRGKTAQKRRRPVKDLGANKKARKLVKIRKVSKNQPCCLCPNDFSYEELLPTTTGQRAHRVCAMYTPETYIATQDGKEKVFNVDNISKARLDLRCHECKQKKGSCFQCSSAKCTRAYHATCAMQAGVQVDKGEIAVWHEGVEYRDVGFDWRCRLHRTVKRTRITSELSACNHSNAWIHNREFIDFLRQLQAGELVQWQATNADDIEAGVVVHPYDLGANSLLVSVLPDRKTFKEVEPAWILFVDSATSCLQKPTPHALDLPESLQGMTASMPASSERKPSDGDPFTEDPKTEWAEFNSHEPPRNQWQKKVDLTKAKQLWHYMGQFSTESKAQYIADPSKPVHDHASNFLDTVDPPKSAMAPPPQPRRQSLAASYPMIPGAARHASMLHRRQQAVNPSATTPSILPSSPLAPAPTPTPAPAPASAPAPGPAAAAVPAPALTPASTPPAVPASVPAPAATAAQRQPWVHASSEKMMELQRTNHAKPSQHRDVLAAADARANEHARILQRQQVKAQQLDMQDRTPTFTHGIGIDQQAIARQKQFQQLASLQSRNMGHHHSHTPFDKPMPTFQHLPTYQQPAPYQDTYGPTNGRPQIFQYSNDWLGAASTHAPVFSPVHSPVMPQMKFESPQLAESPIIGKPSTVTAAPAPHQQSQRPRAMTQPSSLGSGMVSSAHPHSRSHSRHTSRTDARLPPTQGVSPQTPGDLERQRRISNPAYPFKSPEQIVAQKEERERYGSQSSGSRPGSRPGSGYTTTALPSPGLHPVTFGPEPQHPPMFINPNATQISPPGSSAGHRHRGGSISGPIGPMAPPPQTMPSFRRSMSSGNMSLGRFGATSLGIRHISLAALSHPAVRPVPVAAVVPPHKAPLPDAPVARPSPLLTASLQPRPTSPGGIPLNDQPIPAVYQDWIAQGGFWGRVATHYLRQHERAPTLYKSPFGHASNVMMPTAVGSPDGLAGRFYDTLTAEQKQQIDQVRRPASG